MLQMAKAHSQLPLILLVVLGRTLYKQSLLILVRLRTSRNCSQRVIARRRFGTLLIKDCGVMPCFSHPP